MQKWSKIGEKIDFSYLILFVSTLKEKLGYKSKGFQYFCKLMFCTTNLRMMINDFCICILLQKVVISMRLSVCQFVCEIITQEPLDQFALNQKLRLRNSLDPREYFSLVQKFLNEQAESLFSRQRWIPYLFFYKVVISVRQFVCPVTSQECYDRFASNFAWRTLLNQRVFLCLV